MTYTETGGYSGELFVTYDNFGNMADLRDSSGNSVEALLVDPNNSAITQYYNPADIDNPFTYRAREGFIGIEMWPGNNTGVYLQGHLVIPNPWGNVFTNGTTTTTTTDTTAKGGGDGEEPCGKLEDCKDNCKDKFNAKLAAMGIGANTIIAIIGILASCPEPIFTKLGALIAWIERNNCIKKCEEKYGSTK